MSGCIDDVDAMIQPETSRRGRRNSNAAFLLLGHPVHSSCTFMHLTHTVNFLGVEEHTLCRGRFASIYMSNNTNISGFFQWKFSRHNILLFLLFELSAHRALAALRRCSNEQEAHQR